MSGLEECDDDGSDETDRRPLRGRPGPTHDAATASVVIAGLLFFVCVFPFVLGPIAAALGGLGLVRASRYGVGRVVSFVGIALGVAAVITGLVDQNLGRFSAE